MSDWIVSSSRWSTFSAVPEVAAACFVNSSRRRSTSLPNSKAASWKARAELPACSAASMQLRFVISAISNAVAENEPTKPPKKFNTALPFADERFSACFPICTPRTCANGASRNGNPNTTLSRSSGEIGSSYLKYSKKMPAAMSGLGKLVTNRPLSRICASCKNQKNTMSLE